MNKSCSKELHAYRERAIELVRDGAGIYRTLGQKTVAALSSCAPFFGISERRAHSLFFRQGQPLVWRDELRRILGGAVALRRDAADKLRDKAAQLDREADELELQQKQFDLWGAGECQPYSGNGSPQRRAA